MVSKQRARGGTYSPVEITVHVLIAKEGKILVWTDMPPDKEFWPLSICLWSESALLFAIIMFQISGSDKVAKNMGYGIFVCGYCCFVLFWIEFSL